MLLHLLACSPVAEGWRVPAADLSAGADDVRFAAAGPHTTADATLTIHNAGDLAATLDVSVSAPFSAAAARLDVPAAGAADLTLRFTPEAYAEVSGTLALVWDGGALEVPLVGATASDADGDGFVAREAGGDDCDDGNAAVWPGAPDACGDGVDADCAGDDDTDCDHDGFGAAIDCDDADDDVHPGADDADTDGRDDDCDGIADDDPLAPGDLVISELHPDGHAWIEICAARAVALTGLTLRTDAGASELDGGRLDAGECGTVCEDGTCTSTAAVALGDLVRIDAGSRVLDAVRIDASWGPAGGRTWSLGAGEDAATGNDRAAWCLTDGSPGEPNPACPGS